MSRTRAVLFAALLGAAGCRPDMPPAPEEIAIDRFAVAENLEAAKRYDDAVFEYEFVIHHRWRWKEPYVRLAHCHEAAGRDAAAIAALERLIIVDGGDDDALRGLGRLYARQGDSRRALENYRRLRTQHPDDAALAGEITRLEAMGKP
jgi:tetratricopeptide (TPR) repeat protein